MNVRNFTSCLLGAVVFAGCNGSRSVSIDYGNVPQNSSVMELAVSDLQDCLKEVPASAASSSFAFTLDPALKKGEFGYQTDHSGNVVFRAGDEVGITHAVYTYLEKLGYTFDITGISAPEKFTTTSGMPLDTLVTPAVRWRGIRQHVNFPMDISSYTIEDAKTYVDQLVRMRFNKLVLHSYPGQWYETHMSDSLALAGNYFYGNKHFMYDNAFLQEAVKSNDSLFCIPAAEPLRHDAKANSKFAVAWMQQLITHAKARGLYVQMSFEPRVTTVEQVVTTAHDILNQYPGVDALELITEETGGWGKGCTKAETKATLKKYFTPEIADDATVNAPIRDKQSDLNTLYTQIGLIKEGIEQLRKENSSSIPELKLGIYCSITSYTEAAYRLARLALPDTKICLMSSHGSEGTAKALPSVLKSDDDRAMTELYSWIEFDGLMYLFQNSIGGNEKMMQWLAQEGDTMVPSILFNHWRTAENRTSARYAAEATINPGLTGDNFYQRYAMRLSLPQPQQYVTALQLINEADVFSTTQLGNIGFCWMGAWRNGGSYTWMKKENILHARELYFKAGNLLTAILKQTTAGTEAHRYLSFVCNRVLCSVLYLDAFAEAVEIQHADKAGKPGSDEAKAYVRKVCDKALLIFGQYMEKHAEMMPDRGCEGTLVSVWNAPMRGLKIYRERLGGVPMDGPSSMDAVDAPPLPIVY